MAYGTVKVDNITFDDGGSDQNVTVSGLYNSLTSGITVTGTISGAVVIGSTSVSGTTVAGVTVTGTTVQGASGTFTSLTGTTIQGTTATYTTGSFTSLTGTTIQGTTATYTTGSFTSLTGTTTTGTTANFASGVFTTSVSGTTVIASTGTFTSLTGTTTQGTTATYTTGSFTSLTGTTTTGTTSSFTSGVFTTLSGATATFTSGIIASGTAAAPSLAILGDPDTGVFSPGANQLAVATNGTGRLFVDAVGNVGINDAIPNSYTNFTTLSLNGTTGSEIDLQSGGTITGTLASSASYCELTSSAALRFVTAGTFERLRITSAGLVGIGTSTPATALDVNGSINFADSSIVGSTKLNVSTDTTQAYYFGLARENSLVRFNGMKVYNNANGISGAPASRIGFFTDLTGALPSTERLTITETGNVGIGTTSPSSKFVVEDSAALKIAVLRTATGVVGLGVESGPYIYSDGALQFRVGATAGGSADERARIDTSGRLLVGTSTARTINASHTGQIQLEGTNFASSTMSIIANSNDAAGSYLFFGKSRGTTIGSNTIVQNEDVLGQIDFFGSDGVGDFSAGARMAAIVDGTPGSGDLPTRLVFSVTADGAASPTERMRISNNGTTNSFSSDSGLNVRVSATAGTATALHYGLYGATSTTTGTISYVVWSNGNVQNTNNSYGAYSDIKLKENIVDANSQWDDLKALQVRNYNFKEGQTHTQIGLVAQEAELVSPGLVSESPDRDEDGNDLGTVTKSVNYSVLYMKAVKALQEAMERIEVLEQRLTDAGIA